MPIKHAILIKILRCFFRLHANYTFFLSFEKKEKGVKIFLKGDRRPIPTFDTTFFIRSRLMINVYESS